MSMRNEYHELSNELPEQNFIAKTYIDPEVIRYAPIEYASQYFNQLMNTINPSSLPGFSLDYLDVGGMNKHLMVLETRRKLIAKSDTELWNRALNAYNETIRDISEYQIVLDRNVRPLPSDLPKIDDLAELLQQVDEDAEWLLGDSTTPRVMTSIKLKLVSSSIRAIQEKHFGVSSHPIAQKLMLKIK